MSVRLGVVGLGAVWKLVHGPMLARDPRFHVAAVADARPDRAKAVAEEHRARAVAPDELLAQDLDAVLILTSGDHVGFVREALLADLPVLCEKPLAYTRQDIRSLPATGRLQVGYMKVHDPAVTRARHLSDLIGPLQHADVEVLHPSMARQIDWHPDPPVAAGGAGPDLHDHRERALGSAAAAVWGGLYTDVLLGSLVHDLAVLRALTGDPEAIDFADVSTRGEHHSVTLNGRLRGDAGLSFAWHYLPQHPDYRERISLHGEEGSLILEFPGPYHVDAPTYLTLRHNDDGSVTEQRWAEPLSGFGRQLDAFHAVTAGDQVATPGTADALADVTSCQQIVAALASRVGTPIGGEVAQ